MKMLLALLPVYAAVAGCDVCDGPDIADGVVVREQSDLDDLDGAVCIVGDLIIGLDEGEGGDPVSAPLDLAPLADLTIIEGDLRVAGTTALAKLDLPALTFVGRRILDPDSDKVRGGLFVFTNSALTSFDLASLTDVGGCTELAENPVLDSGEIDDLLSDVKSHAFPGSCDGATEQNIDNGGPL